MARQEFVLQFRRSRTAIRTWIEAGIAGTAHIPKIRRSDGTKFAKLDQSDRAQENSVGPAAAGPKQTDDRNDRIAG
jgi:hypothetical protein